MCWLLLALHEIIRVLSMLCVFAHISLSDLDYFLFLFRNLRLRITSGDIIFTDLFTDTQVTNVRIKEFLMCYTSDAEQSLFLPCWNLKESCTFILGRDGEIQTAISRKPLACINLRSGSLHPVLNKSHIFICTKSTEI